MDERFELIIDVQSKGIRATLEEIEAADKALASLSADGKISNRTFQESAGVFAAVASQLQKMDSVLKSGRGSWDHFTAGVKDARKEAEQLAKTQAELRSAQKGVAGAQTSRSFEAELQGLSKLEQAERRLAEARREYYNANRQVSRATASGDAERQISALKRQEAAIGQVASAEREKARQVAASSKEEQAFLDQIAASHKRNAEARRRDDVQDREKQAAAIQKATEAELTANNQLAGNLPRLRYALYDVSSAFGVAGAAALGLSVATATTAIQMDRDFADVRRTTGAVGLAARDLRSDFDELFTTMPVKWGALTSIGELAGQLNIATTDVAEFTKLVAQFSATTDVSVEASATAFGRLAQLLNVTSEDYSRLGSSILKVGVNSVATESQIISISTQIAGIARQAGLSADEVFGLSAAIASLGIQPELARGTMTRLFTQIEVAISGSGDALDRFAKISGRTANDFKSSWGTDSAGVLQDFLRGLGGIAERGGSAAAALRELGITSVRDVPALLRLAQSSDMVAEALALSAQGWQENTELQSQYDVIAGTVSAKIEVLVNRFNKLVESLGSTAAGAHVVVDFIGGLLDILNRLAENPIISVMAGFGLIVGTLVGVLGLMVAAVARGAASFLALRTAQQELTRGTGGLSAAVSAFTAIMHGNTAAISQNTSAKAANSSATAGMASAHAGGAASTNKLTSALGRGGLVGSLLLAVPLLAELTNLGLESLASGAFNLAGLNKETREFVNILGSMSEGVSGIDEPITGLLDRLASFSQLGAAGGPILANLEEQARRIDEAFKFLAESGEAAFVTVQLNEYVDRLIEAGVEADVARGYFQQTFDVLDSGNLVIDQATASIDGYVEGLKESLEAILGVVDENNQLQSSLDALAQSFLDNGAITTNSSNEMLSAIRRVFDLDPQNAANNLQALFDTIVAGSFASASELGVLRQAIAALGGATGKATTSFRNFGQGLTRTVPAASRASKAVREVREEVRTLVDYANDLQGIFSRAFDIRFAGEQPLDRIAETFLAIREASEQAARNIRSLQADIQGLQSDIAIQEYFLGIAIEYGDTKRAEAIQANLAKLQANLADKTAELSKEQDKNSKALTGNTQGAIDNRKELLGLLGEYQNYIKELAAAGLEQSDLTREVGNAKQAFIDQAVELGYSRDEVDKYAQSFDDMAVAIARVPKNVTVSANTNPAMQALEEYEARLRRIGDTTYGGGTVAPPTVSTTPPLTEAQWMRQFAHGISASASQAQWDAYIAQARARYQSYLRGYGFADGGFTGQGGKYEPAGIVHRGEYVIPKEHVNQRTGLPYADALGRLNRGASGPGYASGGYVTSSAQAMALQLASMGPMAMQQFHQVMGDAMKVYLDGRTISQSTSQNYVQQTAVGAN